MEEKNNFFEPLLQSINDYGKTGYELIKLKTIEKSVDVISKLAVKLIILFTVMLCLIFGSIGVSFWIGELVGYVYFGFMIVAAFYAFVSIIILLFLRKWMRAKFSNSFISKLFYE